MRLEISTSPTCRLKGDWSSSYRSSEGEGEEENKTIIYRINFIFIKVYKEMLDLPQYRERAECMPWRNRHCTALYYSAGSGILTLGAWHRGGRRVKPRNSKKTWIMSPGSWVLHHYKEWDKFWYLPIARTMRRYDQSGHWPPWSVMLCPSSRWPHWTNSISPPKKKNRIKRIST